MASKKNSKSPASPDLFAGQLLIYSEAVLNLQVRLEGETVWLSRIQIAELFQTTPQNITLHVAAIYDEGELDPGATSKDYLLVQSEGGRQVRRSLKHYSLGMILAVGYRVRSPRGTQFRQWATARLGELLVKGFTLDDERIKAGRTLGQGYFDELLARIRDIRSSERLFYQKITDIYSTRIPPPPDAAGQLYRRQLRCRRRRSPPEPPLAIAARVEPGNSDTARLAKALPLQTALLSLSHQRLPLRFTQSAPCNSRSLTTHTLLQHPPQVGFKAIVLRSKG